MLQVMYDNEVVAIRAALERAKQGDCAYDLCNASGLTVIVGPRMSKDISAGMRIKIPDGYCGIIRARSSTFVRRGLMVITGVIDSGYTGSLYTLVWNPALNERAEPVLIKPWERISQLLILPVPDFDIVRVTQLPDTERGSSGFGSTGL